MKSTEVQFHRWVPLLMLFRREVHRFLKVTVQTVFTPFISSLLYLLVFGVTLGSRVETQNGVTYLAFLIPGLCMMGLMNNAFQNSSSSVTIGKFTGELEDLKVLPITESQIVTAMALGSVVRGFIVALITYLVGALVFYWQTGQFLGLAHPLALIYFIFMGGLIFGCLGISVAFWAKTFDQISAVSSFVLLPLTYLGGVFISIQNFNPFWQLASKLNPLLYLINGLRYGILGVSDVDMSAAVVVSLVCLALFYSIARWSLKYGSFSRW
jgi:ABC-2 type transport system permease protein